MTATEQPINRIAYIDLNGQLGTISPEGEERRLLTQAGDYFQFPAWSPQGNKLAVIGGQRGHGGVLLFSDVPGAIPRPLYHGDGQTPFYLYWSPDGQRVSFIANHPTEGIGLWLASVAEGQSHLLTTGQPCFWDWTPDGQLILLHTGGEGLSARLAFIDPAGEGVEERLSPPGLFQAPGIAPGGQMWAFATIDMLGHSQLVIEQASGQRQTIPHHGALALGWSPTAARLAFTSPPSVAQSFYGPLRLVEAATGQVTTLTEAMVLAFFWSPDGQRLAYLTLHDDDLTVSGQSSVEHRTRHTNGHTPALSLTAPPRSDAILFDLWLAEIDSGSVHRRLTFEPSPLFINQFMPFFDQYALSHRLWSPDSRALALPIVTNQHLKIVVVPINGGSPRSVAEGVMAFWSQR